jgi:hypothetical protein
VLVFMIPNKLLFKVNAYLSDFVDSTGKPISLSDFICEAIDLYLCCEEENKRLENERKLAELGKNKKK